MSKDCPAVAFCVADLQERIRRQKRHTGARSIARSLHAGPGFDGFNKSARHFHLDAEVSDTIKHLFEMISRCLLIRNAGAPSLILSTAV
jgi:hypothetical protein